MIARGSSPSRAGTGIEIEMVPGEMASDGNGSGLTIDFDFDLPN